MPRASDFFSGKYVIAAELPKERHITAVITGVTEETMQLSNEVKLVLALRNSAGRPWPRGIVLNKTNGTALSAAFGDDTDGWIGKSVEVWAAPTLFAGKPTVGIRLLGIGNGHSAPMPTPAPASREAGGGDLDDEIPFG